MTLGDGKPCERCGTSEWYESNRGCKECARRRAKSWSAENPRRKKENDRRWQRENKERVNAKNRKWRRKNPEKQRAAVRRWRRNNPDKVRRHRQQWREENRERYLELKRVNQNRRRIREMEAEGDFTADEFRQLCEQYGGKCLRCGRDDRKLTPDHVVPLARGGSNDIGNIQPLCFNCNARKRTKTIDYRTKPGLKRWLQRRLFNE